MMLFSNRRTYLFFSFFILSISSAFSHLFDHLKKAEGKSPIHQMQNIDFIYVINLDKRPEKFLQSSQALEKYGIYPYRFSAVNGWELPLTVVNDVGLKYEPWMTSLFATTYPFENKGVGVHERMTKVGTAYFTYGMLKSHIGICLSHISVLQDAWDSGYETIWVMEDDIDIIRDPHLISTLISQLDALVGKENWDVLFTDQNTKGADGEYVLALGAAERPDMDCSLKERYSEKYTMNKEISADFRAISARFGAYSMIIRRSGIRKLLDFAMGHQIFLPYDMDNYLAPGLRRYALTYDVVSTLVGALSDNVKPGYLSQE